MLKRIARLGVILATFAAPATAVAEPFMDSANGHCLLCDLFGGEPDNATSREDASNKEPEPERAGSD